MFGCQFLCQLGTWAAGNLTENFPSSLTHRPIFEQEKKPFDTPQLLVQGDNVIPTQCSNSCPIAFLCTLASSVSRALVAAQLQVLRLAPFWEPILLLPSSFFFSFFNHLLAQFVIHHLEFLALAMILCNTTSTSSLSAESKAASSKELRNSVTFCNASYQFCCPVVVVGEKTQRIEGEHTLKGENCWLGWRERKPCHATSGCPLDVCVCFLESQLQAQHEALKASHVQNLPFLSYQNA